MWGQSVWLRRWPLPQTPRMPRSHEQSPHWSPTGKFKISLLIQWHNTFHWFIWNLVIPIYKCMAKLFLHTEGQVIPTYIWRGSYTNLFTEGQDILMCIWMAKLYPSSYEGSSYTHLHMEGQAIPSNIWMVCQYPTTYEESSYANLHMEGQAIPIYIWRVKLYPHTYGGPSCTNLHIECQAISMNI